VEKIIELQKKIAPELIEIIEIRYNILRHVRYCQPIGRRALAVALDDSERVIRAQTDFLKVAGLVEMTPLGMILTQAGLFILDQLGEYVRGLYGLSGLEAELAEKLGLKRVVIIRGDSEAEISVQGELGRAAALVLGQYLGNNMTIAVSGGSTMARVAEAVINLHAPTTTVVPARGGLAERVEFQANTIAAHMANRLGGKYRLLHIPEGMGDEALEAILVRDANVRLVAQMIKQADILLAGIGEAASMAARLGFEQSIIDRLGEWGAVGESLGHYCTLSGQVVYTTSSIGLRLEDLDSIGQVIGVAGGRRKAGAIVAVAAAGGQDVLVTDEAAARAIQEIVNKK
jgi:central glycolytic genes regulator